MPTVDIATLLPTMSGFIRNMHYVRMDFQLEPNKEHVATCINRNDILEVREDFLRAMVSSVVRYVYSSDQYEEIKRRYISKGQDEMDVPYLIMELAKNKFRDHDIKGQFTELLLYNLLIYHFNAAPLVRKMSITTNPALERNGADAIHIANNGEGYILYLGEAKTYTSGFKKALKAALSSIMKSYHDHRSELDLYVYDKFVSNELEELIQDYKENINVEGIEVHTVCIIAYETNKETKGDRDQALKCIIDDIITECSKIAIEDYPDIDANIKSRINYILFPVWQLDILLNEFKTKLGI